MRPSDWLPFVPVLVSLALYLTMVGAFLVGMKARARPKEPLDRAPRVSILKPIAGVDEELRENLETFAHIDYPSFELLIGVVDAEDPAYLEARAFIRAHPELDARLVLTGAQAATNPKVAQLLGLERVATGEVLLISDANVRVAPDYLFGIVHALAKPGVGLVSSVVAGTGETNLGAAIENLQLSSTIASGVVAAATLGNRPLTIGKSMAMWRRDLARLGGFHVVAHVLAEDYVLGRIFRRAGYGVGVVLDPVENRNVRCTVARTLERHTRWAKMRRAIVPRAFLFEPLLSPLGIAVATWVVHPVPRALAAVAFCSLLQTFCAALAVWRVRPRTMRWWWLAFEPVRSLLLNVCWLRALLDRSVEWRGHHFLIEADSALVPDPRYRRSHAQEARR